MEHFEVLYHAMEHFEVRYYTMEPFEYSGAFWGALCNGAFWGVLLYNGAFWGALSYNGAFWGALSFNVAFWGALLNTSAFWNALLHNGEVQISVTLSKQNPSLNSYYGCLYSLLNQCSWECRAGFKPIRHIASNWALCQKRPCTKNLFSSQILSTTRCNITPHFRFYGEGKQF